MILSFAFCGFELDAASQTFSPPPGRDGTATMKDIPTILFFPLLENDMVITVGNIP
jgi:hypothetical protein